MAIDTKAGSDPPPTVINEANCVGTEKTISQCPQDGSHICLNLGAGVICPQLVKGNNHLLFNNIHDNHGLTFLFSTIDHEGSGNTVTQNLESYPLPQLSILNFLITIWIFLIIILL